MKKLNLFVLSLLLMTNSNVIFGQTAINAAATNLNNTATVIFMRSTGFNGSAVAFTAFIDDKLTCKLNNKRFSTHMIPSGDHTFSVQFAGKDSKQKAERIMIKTEPGKTYYIQFVFQPGLMVNNLYCQEVTESSAKTILPKLKEDTQCL